MLFMYIHTHSVEKCMADKPDEVRKMYTQFQEGAAKAGVKIMGMYLAAHEHTIYSIFETDDIVALETILTPMTLWGDADLIPITSPGQTSGR